MKYANVMLTLIVVMLIVLLFQLIRFESLLMTRNQDNDNLVLSNQAIIQSNQRLEMSLSGLRAQIDSFAEKLPKK